MDTGESLESEFFLREVELEDEEPERELESQLAIKPEDVKQSLVPAVVTTLQEYSPLIEKDSKYYENRVFTEQSNLYVKQGSRLGTTKSPSL